MTSLLKSIDYKSGNIKFMENELVFEDYIVKQLIFLREDLLQVEFDFGKYILDIGWYPSFEENGAFHVIVVKNANWSTPIYNTQTTVLANLQQTIQAAVDALEAKRFEQ